MGEDASAIRHEIELTRERMGDTVEALGYKADVPSRVKDNVQQRVDAAKGAISDVVDSVKSSVSGVSDATASSSRDGGKALSQVGENVRGRIGEINDGLTDRLQDIDVPGNTKRAVGAIQENPIGLALAALAIGFLSGSLVPVSEIERKRLAPIRSKIVDQAQAAASDIVEAGKAVVMETAHTAVTSAITSAQSHGHDVVDAAKVRVAQN